MTRRTPATCSACGHTRENFDQAAACCTMQGVPCPQCTAAGTPLDRLTATRDPRALCAFDGTSYGMTRRPWIVSTPQLTDDGRPGLAVVGAETADEARARALTMFLQFQTAAGICAHVDSWTIEAPPAEIATLEDMLYVCVVLGALAPGLGVQFAGYPAEGRAH